MKQHAWFDVDRKGLAQILQRKGKEFALFELIQNAWDEEGVTRVNVRLTPASTPGYAWLSIIDDAPQGFADISHAYTLFAASRKKDNPQKRGRFNLGEKLVLALANQAEIRTTTGTVIFTGDGRRRTSNVLSRGSEIHMTLRMTKAEVEQAIAACNKLISPVTISTTINGQPLTGRTPLKSFETTLPTEVSDAEGNLVRTARKTSVNAYEATEQCPAAIYELGIPVCEIDGRYSFDVMQKIPLTMDREGVLPSFKKQLAVAALNNLQDQITGEDANTTWATEAVTSPDVSPNALNAYLDQKFGPKRVIFDPSDLEANHRAVEEGYILVTGSQLSGAAWANVKAANAMLPAGQVTPSAKPYSQNGDPLKLVKEITPEMAEVETYAKKVAYVLMSVNISVRWAAEPTWPYAATYGKSHVLTLNAGQLGKAWFNLQTNQEGIDDLLIHEFGHEYESNHLSENYHRSLTRLGSSLAQAIRAGKL